MGGVGGFGKLCVPLERSWLHPWVHSTVFSTSVLLYRRETIKKFLIFGRSFASYNKAIIIRPDKLLRFIVVCFFFRSSRRTTKTFSSWDEN